MDIAALSSYRKNDPVIYICQDNAHRTIEISALNPEAENITGYGAEEITGKPFSSILPERIIGAIDDMVEFEPGARDISEALLKCRDFSVRSKSGSDVACKVRVVRCAPVDEKELFQLVLVGGEARRQAQQFRQVLTQNFKGHEVLDEKTGLPNRVSLLKDLELTLFHALKKELPACFAIIDIDNYEACRRDFGDEVALAVYRHIAGIIRRTLRSDDTLGMLSGHALGAILMDTNRESARMACNRLRWSIAASPIVLPSGMQVPVTTTIAYMEIADVASDAVILESCESKITRLREASKQANGLYYIPAEERRTHSDRRKQHVSVGKERRRGDRRNNT